MFGVVLRCTGSSNNFLRALTKRWRLTRRLKRLARNSNSFPAPFLPSALELSRSRIARQNLSNDTIWTMQMCGVRTLDALQQVSTSGMASMKSTRSFAKANLASVPLRAKLDSLWRRCSHVGLMPYNNCKLLSSVCGTIAIRRSWDRSFQAFFVVVLMFKQCT